MYVELRDINKSFGSYQASRRVSFGVEKGTLTALLGPSGSGKTTILRMISGLEQPDSGDILIDGTSVVDVPAAQRGIGFVFQNYALFRYMTVRDNIAFGLEVNKVPKAEQRERVDELLELIDLKDLGDRYPGQLSGGQRQRVAFARALAPNPQVLLLDEPFAAIDAKIRKELRSWLKQTIRQLGITSIFVTHDQEEAIEVADRIVLTNEGRVEQVGTPAEIYREPATEFAAGFFGEPSVLEDYRVFNTFGSPEALEGSTRAIVRPEHVEVVAPGEMFRYQASSSRGIVTSTLFLGRSVEVTVDVNDVELKAIRSPEAPALNPGDAVDVFVYRMLGISQAGLVVPLKNRALREESVLL